MSTPLIEFDHAGRAFTTPRGTIKAVDDVSFSVEPGEILCLVGESGCGKTTTGKMVTGLVRPTSGRVLFEGRDIWAMPEREFKVYRKAVQIVHQDPYASLNPIRTVFQTLSAPLLHHGLARSRGDAIAACTRLLRIV